MKQQTFINRYSLHQAWRPGQDGSQWFKPVEQLVKDQNEVIESYRTHGFVENGHADKDGNWVPGVRYPNAHTIAKFEQGFFFEIDEEGVFRYTLRTDVFFLPGPA